MPVTMVQVGDAELCVDTYGAPGRPGRPADGRRHLLDGLVGARVLRAHRLRRPVRDPLRQPGHRRVHDLPGRGAVVHRGRPVERPAAHPRRPRHRARAPRRRLHGWRHRAGHRRAAPRAGAQPDPDRDDARPSTAPTRHRCRRPSRASPRPSSRTTTSTGTTPTPSWTRWSRCTGCTPVRSASTRNGSGRSRAQSWTAPATSGQRHQPLARDRRRRRRAAHDGRGAGADSRAARHRRPDLPAAPTDARWRQRSRARGWCRWRGWATRCRRRALWDVVVPAIVEHTGGASAAS